MKAEKLKKLLRHIPDDVNVVLSYGGYTYDFNAIVPNGEKSVALADVYQNGENIAAEETFATLISYYDC